LHFVSRHNNLELYFIGTLLGADMKKLSVVGALLVSLTLGGCTAEDVQKGMAQACNYLPAEQAVVTIISVIYPGVGAILSATQMQTVIEAGCKAVIAAKSKKSFIAPASISANVIGADGKRYSVPLGGSFVRP
jgi:hypothetical protein